MKSRKIKSTDAERYDTMAREAQRQSAIAGNHVARALFAARAEKYAEKAAFIRSVVK